MKLKTTVSVSLMLLLLIGTLGLRSEIRSVRSESGTWTVDDDGPADFHTIGEAIDAASDGDTIQVFSGIYQDITVSKSVSLIGENRDTTIIDGNGYQQSVALGSNSSITGFTIRSGEFGVLIRNFGPTFMNCTVKGNRITGNSYGGVYLHDSGNITLSDNLIENNGLFGVFLYAASNNTITNNTITNNEHGLTFSQDSHDNILRNNMMTHNKYNFGLIIPQSRNYLFVPELLTNDVDTSNTIDGKPIYCWVNRHNEQIPQNAGYVWLTSCTNITVRGLSLSNNLQGVLLMRSNNTMVADNTIANNAYGIYTITYSSNNTFVNNTVRDNAVFGVFLSALSMFTTMRNNSISGSQMNFGLYMDVGRTAMTFTYPLDLLNDVDMSNTVDGKPIVYWINQHNRHVPENTGYVALVNCSDIVIEDLNLTNNVQNILILATNNTVIANSSIANSIYGIEVRDVSYLLGTGVNRFCSFNTTISGNILVDNVVAIMLRSNQSKVLENTLYRNMLGICLLDSWNSTISQNVLCACAGLMSVMAGRSSGAFAYFLQFFYYPEDPVYYSREGYMMQWGGIVVGGSFNVICNNTVMNCGKDGISMYDWVRAFSGHDNLIFHNNFINNYSFQAEEAPQYINVWDNGYPSGGNYWSDYAGVDIYSGADQNELGSDGIGDTPYMVPAMPSGNASEDHYPLMGPIPWTSELDSSIGVGVNSNDWIKYDYVVSGSPSGTSLPDWMKIEFLTVEGTVANVNVTMHLNNGTELGQTMYMDFVSGNGTLGTFSGFVIPTESAAGDFAYLSGIESNVMILDETMRIYAGARRIAVRASFPSNGIQFNYYWDKQTGVMLEALAVSDYLNASARASETNMWQRQSSLTDVNNDGVVNIVDITAVAKSFGTEEGHMRYNPIADLDENRKINIVDITLVAKDYGKTV